MATQLLAQDDSADTSSLQTIPDQTRWIVFVQTSQLAVDPMAFIEIEGDNGEFVHFGTLSDHAGEGRAMELFGPMSFRIRRPAGFGECSVWSDQ